MKQAIAGRAKRTRRAIVLCGAGGVTSGTVGDGKIRIVHYHQIQPAVAVVIGEGGAGAPTRIISTTLVSHVDKSPVAFVEIHLVRTQICKVQVRPAIVIDVAYGHTHPVAFGDNAALRSHIGELECTAAVFADHQVVAEQTSAWRFRTTPGKLGVSRFASRFENIALY